MRRGLVVQLHLAVRAHPCVHGPFCGDEYSLLGLGVELEAWSWNGCAVNRSMHSATGRLSRWQDWPKTHICQDGNGFLTDSLLFCASIARDPCDH
eukprot:4378197-Amphidinium_carterae.1